MCLRGLGREDATLSELLQQYSSLHYSVTGSDGLSLGCRYDTSHVDYSNSLIQLLVSSHAGRYSVPRQGGSYGTSSGMNPLLALQASRAAW